MLRSALRLDEWGVLCCMGRGSAQVASEEVWVVCSKSLSWTIDGATLDRQVVWNSALYRTGWCMARWH